MNDGTSNGENRIIQLTPQGRGAVAVLLVTGPDALTAINKRFQTHSGQALNITSDIDRPIYGRFLLSASDEPNPPEQVPANTELSEQIVVRIESPESVELHCHGGPLIIRRIIDAVTSLGITHSTLTDLNINTDTISDERYEGSQSIAQIIKQEAITALSHVKTSRTAAILMDQYHGALASAIHEIRQLQQSGETSRAQEMVSGVLHYESLGLHLITPWDVVLAGPPNVGKSSLLNAAAGYRRAIVDHTPGTTRDLVTVETVLDGWPVRLCDTAGLRDTEQPIELEGIDRTRLRLHQADLVLLIHDVSCNDPNDELRRLQADFPDAINVHNKIDLLDSSSFSIAENSGNDCIIPVSATSGEGLDQLLNEIVRRIVPDVPMPGQPVPFTKRQCELIKSL